MSDFLTRLAERAMGLVPVAKPVISPMFAPGVPGNDQSVLEFNFHNAQYRKNLATVPESDPVNSEISRNEIMNPRSEPMENMPVIISSDANISGHDNGEKIEPEKQISHRKEDFRAQMDKLSTIRQHIQIAPESQKGTISSQQNELEQRNAQPFLMKKSEPSTKLLRNQTSRDQASPIIHVSIGRIEVRAVTPPQPSMQKNKPAVPTLSLDDYLKKHNGGR